MANPASGFIIKPPTTTGDDGSASDHLWRDSNRLFAFIDDERHLAALRLYDSVISRFEKLKALHSPNQQQPNGTNGRGSTASRFSKRGGKKERLERERQLLEIEKVDRLLQKKQHIITKLKNHCRLFEAAKKNLDLNEDWTLAQVLFGVTTYYRREPDGSLSIKLEGKLEGVPLFEQVAVLREVDLHCKWAPFCSSSLTVTHLDKLDTVGWFIVGLPNFGLARDGCFRAIGCDSIEEDGSILLVGEGLADRPGIDKAAGKGAKQASADANQPQNGAEAQSAPYSLRDDPVVTNLELPPPPTRMGSGRMTIRTFQATIEVTSPTTATSKLIANVDPNLSLLPQGLLDFLMKKLCGVLLHKLQGAAKRVVKDPVANPHAIKMRQEQLFYKDWLMVKFQRICDIRGWQMPPVSAFDLTPQQEIQAMKAEEKAFMASKKKYMHARSADSIGRAGTPKVQFRGMSTMPELSDAKQEQHASLSSSHRYTNHSTSDSDTISELSLNSSSTMSSMWRKNPVSTYLREIEEKTQQRKAKKIADARTAAAHRLRPKGLRQNQQARLAELRAAKVSSSTQSSGNSTVTTTSASPTAISTTSKDRGINGIASRDLFGAETQSFDSSIKDEQPTKWAIQWNDHDVLVRACTVLSLLLMLFGSLSMKSVIGKTLFLHDADRWYVAAAKDTGTILYMVLVAVMHFALCYAALMYSFGALHIGQIAGLQARKFYSENVHLVVASSSAAMIAISLLKVGIGIFLRYSVWFGVQTRQILAELVTWLNPWRYRAVSDAVDHLLTSTSAGLAWNETIVPNLVPVLEHLRLVAGMVSSALSSAGRIFHAAILESNAAGRFIVSFIVRCGGMASMAFRSWLEYEAHIVAIMREDISIRSWREDALATASLFLSYSAIFLLTLSFLFTVSAHYARRERDDSGNDNDASHGSSTEPTRGSSALTPPKHNGSHSYYLNQHSSQMSATSTTGNRQLQTAASSPSVSKQIGTIKESEEYNSGSLRPGTIVSTETPATSKRRRRYMKLRPKNR